MNYLAHIFLSGPDQQLRLGNFIGDAVKGSSYKRYPAGIARGILMHRAIDHYTDTHQAVRELRAELRPMFGLYSGIVIDIFFDYMLASRFGEFSPVSLRRFTRNFYITMVRNRRWLPARIRGFMWHFILSDRLGRYATVEGVARSLDIMVGVRGLDIQTSVAVDFLRQNDDDLYRRFKLFFSDLQLFCADFSDLSP